jgi:hypothetical protein
MPIKQRVVTTFATTAHATAVDKQRFYDHFIVFVESGFKEELFHDWFYRKLSNCFGHIAHYDRIGFYDTWFSNNERRFKFIRHALYQAIYGDADYTFCDVERAIQQWLFEHRYIDKYENYAAAAVENQERDQLKYLKEKYPDAR